MHNANGWRKECFQPCRFAPWKDSFSGKFPEFYRSAREKQVLVPRCSTSFHEVPRLIVNQLEGTFFFILAFDFCSFRFWQTLENEVVRIGNPLAELGIAKTSDKRNRVPVLLAHVIAGLHFTVLFAKLKGGFRVAFQVDAFAGFDVGQAKHFSAHGKDKCGFAKRHFFGGAGKRKAIVTQGVEGHLEKKFFRKFPEKGLENLMNAPGL